MRKSALRVGILATEAQGTGRGIKSWGIGHEDTKARKGTKGIAHRAKEKRESKTLKK
jgi:hypothetical protein